MGVNTNFGPSGTEAQDASSAAQHITMGFQRVPSGRKRIELTVRHVPAEGKKADDLMAPIISAVLRLFMNNRSSVAR